MMNKETEYENFLKWLIKQQYYIIHPNIKKKIKSLLKEENDDKGN